MKRVSPFVFAFVFGLPSSTAATWAYLAVGKAQASQARRAFLALDFRRSKQTHSLWEGSPMTFRLLGGSKIDGARRASALKVPLSFTRLLSFSAPPPVHCKHSPVIVGRSRSHGEVSFLACLFLLSFPSPWLDVACLLPSLSATWSLCAVGPASYYPRPLGLVAPFLALLPEPECSYCSGLCWFVCLHPRLFSCFFLQH
jgi:hypothetical protein